MGRSDQPFELPLQLAAARFDDHRKTEQTFNVFYLVQLNDRPGKPDLGIFSEKAFIALFYIQGGDDSAKILTERSFLHLCAIFQLTDIFELYGNLHMIRTLSCV